MIGQRIIFTLLAAALLLGASNAQAAVTTYTDEATYLADLATLGYEVANEGFDSPDWLATETFPVLSLTNNGLTWAESNGSTNTFLMTTTSGLVGSALRTLNSTATGHTDPDGFYLKTDTATTPNSLNGFGAWYKGSQNGSKLTFTTNGGGVGFTGEESTVLTTWKFLGFIDDAGFTTLDVRVVDDPANTDVRLIFADTASIGAPVGTFPAGALDLSEANYPVNENDGTVNVTVNRTGGSFGAITVDYATSNGTATSGSDYQAVNSTLTFAENEYSKVITVNLLNDTVYEGSESFSITLSNPGGGATLGTTTTASIDIADDEPPPSPGTLALSTATETVVENAAGGITLTVSRTGGSDGTVTVDYATADGSALQPGDYTQATGTLTFLDGELSQTIPLTLTNDTTWEPSEDFTVTLSNVVEAALGQAITTVTITDDDTRNAGTLALSTATENIAENAAGGITLTVSRTGGSDGTVTVDYATADGSALQPGDYTQATGTLTFLDGELSQTIPLTLTNDATWEPSEDFTVTLSNVVEAALGQAITTVTITDDDTRNAGTLALSTATENIAENAAGGITLTVSRTGGSDGTVTVDYATADGSALQPGDYTQATGTLTFLDGELSQTIPLTLTNDTTWEPSEDFTVTLNNVVEAALGQAITTVTITDDDTRNAGTLALSTATENIAENAADGITLTVSRTGGSDGTVTVDYATADGSALQPGDYTQATGTLTFLDGELSQTIPLTLTNDTTWEPSEDFTVTLNNVVEAALGQAITTVTITDDDTRNAGTLALSTATENIAENAAGGITLTVSRTGGSDGTVTVDYATADGSALQPGDYTQATGTLTFLDGELSQTIPLTLTNDTTWEPSEDFTVTLSNVVEAALGQAITTVTITDDDTRNAGTLALSTATENIAENAAGGITLTVSRTGGSDGTVTVDYATADGSALQPGDYTQATGTLTFLDGELSQTIPLTLTNDTTWEPSEDFTVTLNNVVDASLGQSAATITITDDDTRNAGTLALSTATETVVENAAGGITLTVSRTGGSDGTVTVDYATADGSALQPGDYTQATGTLTFLDGELSQTIPLTLTNDTTWEPSEDFTVTLNNVVDASLGQAITTVTITDDDTRNAGTLALSTATETVVENAAGGITLTVSRTGGSDGTVTVDYATADGSALQPGDYTQATGTLTFLDGELSQTIPLTLTNDTTWEPSEDFTVTLNNVVEAALGQAITTVTITDDDTRNAGTLALSTATENIAENAADGITLTVSRTGGSDGTVTVDYATADGSALQPGDYTQATGTLTFLDGELSQTIPLTLTNDTTWEPSEDFTVTLNNVVEAALGQAITTVTITDDDTRNAGTLALSTATENIAENAAGGITLTVSRTGGSDGTVTVDYATADGSALQPGDYTQATGTLTFLDGELSQTIPLTLTNDTTWEPSEDFTVTLSNVVEAALGQAITTVTITDDDTRNAGTLALSTATENIAENAAGGITLTVSRTGGSDGTVTVDYATADGSALQPGDYTQATGTLTFLDGELSQTIPLTLTNDTTWEPSEDFTVTLNNVVDASLGQSAATITITDDDTRNAGTLALSTATETVVENAAGGITLTVSRTGGSDGTVTVDYATADGSALQPGDYTQATGTLTFLDGELSQTIPLTLTNDTTWEPSEDFTVTLNNVVEAALGQAITTVTITDDDTRNAGTLALSTATENIAENAADGITLTVSRTGGSDGTVTVDYATADGSALQPGDYTQATGTLTFLDGELSQTIPLTLTNDTTWEPSEDFTVTLNNVVEAALGQAITTVTITDDDTRNAGTLALSTATENIAENAAGGITLTVSRTGGSDGTVTVDYATADGSALQPGDYTQATGTLTFLDGELSQTIPLTLTNDTTWEPSEDFTVTLSNVVEAALGQAITTVTITDDDTRNAGTLALSTATENIAENAAGGITLTVSRTGGSDGTVTVDYATADGSALQPGDYTQATGTLTFLDGELSQTIPLTLTNDATWEPSEDFTVTLSNVVEAALGQAITTVTITDDDTRNAGTLALSTATENIAENAAGGITLTVSRTGGSDGTVTVDYATADGSALQPGDYTQATGTLTFLDGELSQTIPLTLTNDTTWEPSEDFTVTLNNVVEAALGQAITTVTINDDDTRNAGTLALSTATENIAENAAGGITLTVSRTGGSDGTVTVDYATADGSALQPGDYTQATGTLTFLDGELSQTIPLTLTNDTTWEPSEDFTVTLNNVVEAALGQAITTVTITDDDTRNAGTLALSTATENIAENAAGGITLTVSRTGGSDGTVTVDYATADGSALQPGDYTQATGTLTFLDGELSQTIPLTLTNDTTWEPSEDFTVTLNNVVEAALGQAITTVTITDDDTRNAGTLALSTATENIAENAAGGITLTVSRTGGSDGTVTVDYATADGSALQPGDYTQATGTLTFLDGELSQTIPLTLTNDTTWEPSEDFTVTLNNVVDASLGQAITTVTITDDDTRNAGTLALSTATENIAENAAGGITLTVSRTGGSDGTVTVDYATADGSALQPGDYTQATGTLTFLDGELSQTIPLTLTNDTTWEPSEDFTVTLSNVVDATLGAQTSTTVTITDDDTRNAGTLALSNATATLSEGGPAITVTVDRTGGSDGTVAVDYATADGTAAAPGDYTALNGTLTFLNGELSKTLILTPTSDTTWEPSEDFTLNLSNPVDATLGVATATVTINDDDPRSAGTLALSTATENIAENAAGGITLTVSRTGGSDGTVTVDYATADGSALQPGDYTQATGTLTFLDGELSQTIPLTLTNDTTWEPSEDFTVTLNNVVDASLGQAITTVTITDDDTRNAGTLDLSAASATLSESGPAITLTVDRTGGSDGTVAVDYATADGTAAAPGDYTALNGTLTFLNGELSKTLILTPTSDTTWEPSEDFTLNLSNPVDATLGVATATVTINDDDPRSAGTLALSTATESVAENAAGGLTLMVSRTGGTDGAVSVDYATANGTAASPSDYTAASGTLNFLHGETSQTIPLTLTNDTTWEPSEDFTVTLNNVVDATLGAQTSTTVTITDDDTRNAGTLALSNATATLSEGGPAITVTVDRTGGSDGTVTVDYATADGTANAPGDYTAINGTLTFLNGELSKTLILTPTSDTTWEPSEDFTLNLSNPVDATLGVATATVTINDDDPRSAGTLALSTATESVAENAAGGLTLTVSRTGGTDGAVSVDYATANGTAASPSDYTAASGTLNFLHGETSQTIPLTLTNDTTWEPSEDFTVTLNNVVDATLGAQTSTTVTITDDDTRNAGTLALSNATATLSEGGPAITVTVDRTGGSDGTVAVDYATADGTAAAPGDYTALNGTLTFLNGELSKTLILTPTSDTTWEPSEDFTLNLSNPVDATLGVATATVTINDDDPRSAGTLALSTATESVAENAAGGLTLTVSRTGGTDGAVSVDYATANGTAASPSDYTAASGTLNFLHGETSQTIPLTLTNDTTWEPSEDFTVTLNNVVDATLGAQTSTTVTITDDDTRNAGTLALSNATATLSEGGPAITVTVDRTGGSDGTVTVDYATADGTANAPGDYTAINGTLTFLEGEISKTILLTPTSDTVWELNEDFTVTLSNVVDATLGTQTSTTVTITDDDTRTSGTLALSSATATLSEGGPAITLTVVRTGGSDGTVSVDYATADGTATAPGDYTALNGSLTFLNGELSKNLTLTPANDATWEPSETFTLTLGNVVDASLGLSTTTVTITDDDTRNAGTLALSTATESVAENAAGGLTLTVSRTGGTDGAVSVDYATANGTAASPGDYTAVSGTLNFLHGETSKTIPLTLTNDTTWEPSEDFTLTLSNAVDATLGAQTSTTVTITDDDVHNAGTLALNSTTVTLPESGPAMIMTVNRTGGSDGTVTVDYATADGTAAAPGDYTALNGTLTFLNGETSKTVALTPINDTTWEPSEDFTLTLSNPVDATLGLATATVTITDDDPRSAGTLALSSATATLSEGGPAITLTVDRTGGSDGSATVDYATADGTAIATGDYTALNGTLTFLDGELSKTLTLTPTSDTTWEPSEDFTLTLSNVVDATLGLATATVTITDDDVRNAGTLALNSTTVTLSESGPAVNMTVNRTGGSDGTVTVDYATADGTAAAPGDYTELNGTLTFLNGETSKTVTLTLTNDTTWEPSEDFTLTLSNPVDATLAVQISTTVTITDDDPRHAGTLALSSPTAALFESGPDVTMTVNRTGGSDGTVSVDYATTDGTATATGDYTALSGTLTFLNGETSKTIPLTPIDDTTWEPSEDFTLTLSNVVDATLGLATATVTINDDDVRNAGTLALNSTTVTLPESGPAAILTVNRTGGSDGTVSVDYATTDGTATAPGDYTAINGTLTFLNGETSKTIPLTPTDDTAWEPSEAFTLTLSNPVDATLGLATATVTITDDDTRTSGTLALSSATATLSESGPVVTLTVDRTGGSDGTVTVDYATADVTANAPGDYTAISGTLTFLNGELSKTLTLTPTSDTTWEPSEDFTLTLSNAVDASLGLATATVTITDDDTRNAGTLALNSTTVTLPESGPAVIMTVNRTGGSDGTVSVDYATADGTATAPDDYTAINGTLIFLNGETSKTIPLSSIDDATWELSETFTLTLSNAVDATLGLATAVVTITDDDLRSAGTLDLSNAIATLSESGPAVTLTVDRTGGSDGTVSVDYATVDGTATAPGDYTAINGTLTFLDGELSKTLTLTPTGDTIWEPSEAFVVNLSNPVDASLGLASATVTITDDDDGIAPVITIQEPVISVPSTGPFTSVDLGVVTAVDDVDGAVTPVADLTGPFAPGRHLITWRAIDSSSNMASEVQAVDVLPMVNFGVDQVANPGSTVDIPVFLNGDAPEYPVVIDYQITDFDAAGGTVAQTTGTVDIAAGAVPSNQANIQYLIQNAGVARVEVTMLNTGANATFGANNVHTINVNVTEINLPPVVSITGSQNNATTATVFADAALVTITFLVNDPDLADIHTYDWSQSDNGLALQLGAQSNTVVFDPSGLLEGTYKVVVSVTDSAGNTTTVDKSVKVLATAPIFDDDGSDSDSDGVSDFDEGAEDEDEDGIPDYLDPHDDDYILAGQDGESDTYLLITEPGLKLRLSEEKIRDEDYSAYQDEQAFIDRVNGSGGGVADPQDSYTHVGGIFEFEIEGLAYVGQSVRIVIPVHQVIPANAVYRLYTDDVGWHDFVVDDRNSVSSAPGELGICPAPGDVTYIAGLHEGHYCVQLLIEDGGLNDADRRANGKIVDPSGVAIVPTSTPTTPQTSSGGGGGIGGWLLVLLPWVWLRNFRRESKTGIRLSEEKLMGSGFRTLFLAGLLSSGMVSTVSSANGLLSLYEASADSVAATLKPDCAFHAQGEAADKEREFPTIVGGVRSEENQLRYRQVIASSKGYSRTEHNYRMPERKLVSMDGQATSLATELEGDKPVMLNFIFTTCTTICPVLSATFSQVRESLGSESQNVTMVSISIDPEYDTPERLNEYARLYGADDQWRFFTGRAEDIIAIEKAFDAYRGTKMSHEPLTFLRADGDSPWVRIEGIASADDIVKEYEQLVSR